MKQTIIGLFCLMLLTTGQCNQDVRPKDIDPEDLPDIPAFQDEATREFLVSTEEVEPGLYLIESKVEGFQMLFPAGGRYLQDISSISSQGNVETFTFEDFDEEINAQIIGQIRTSYEGTFDKEKMSDKIVYYGSEPRTFQEEGYVSEAYTYVGYIEPRSDQYLAIDYNFSLLCYRDNAERCSESIADKEEQISKMIDSITFINQEEADRDE